jgi:hypothetical protein
MVAGTRTQRCALPDADDVTGHDAYYYDSDGSQVPLHASDEVAVSWDAAAQSELPRDVLATLKQHGRELRGGVAMLPSAAVTDEMAEALDAAGALQPVYRSEDGALVVVLPEVRVEVADEAQAAQVRDYLRTMDLASEVVRDTGEHFVVRPASNRGVDALDLANRLEEEMHPPMTQARFLRVVPRPEG